MIYYMAYRTQIQHNSYSCRWMDGPGFNSMSMAGRQETYRSITTSKQQRKREREGERERGKKTDGVSIYKMNVLACIEIVEFLEERDRVGSHYCSHPIHSLLYRPA